VAIVGHQYSNDVSSTIYHEYLHSVLNSNQANLPLWLNEGFAELYSTFFVEDSVANIGYPIGNHIAWLRDHPLIPLAELVAIDRDSPDYHTGHRRGAFYAQSWALTHMLVMGSTDGKNRATTYADLLRSGVDGETAFQRAMGGTYSEIEIKLKDYVRGRKFSYSKLPLSGAITATSTVTEMSYPEVLCRLGNLLVALGADRSANAARHFEVALEIDPRCGQAVAGLGRLDELAGRTEAALARYERAAELAPDDFMVSFLLGDALYRQHDNAATAAEKKDLANRARKALRRAAVLHPSFAEAWVLLGHTYTWDTEPDEIGIKAMEHAHRLLPKRGDIGYNLTLLYLRSNRLQDARQAVARMKAAGVDTSTVHSAEQLVDQLEECENETNRRIRLANEAGAEVSDLAELQALQAREAEARRRFTDRYNEAVALINAGTTAEGLANLEELAADAPTDGDAAAARALLLRTRAFINVQTKVEEAQTAANSGRLEAAIEIVEPLVQQAPEEAQAAQLREFLAKLHAYRKFQTQYNEAVDLVNRGDFESAVAILENLAASAPSAQMAALAKQLLEESRNGR
jgi:tetratricopeptide (TPR) repeat protein